MSGLQVLKVCMHTKSVAMTCTSQPGDPRPTYTLHATAYINNHLCRHLLGIGMRLCHPLTRVGACLPQKSTFKSLSSDGMSCTSIAKPASKRPSLTHCATSSMICVVCSRARRMSRKRASRVPARLGAGVQLVLLRALYHCSISCALFG